MMFQSKHVPLPDAEAIVSDRTNTPKERQNPLWLAIDEGAIELLIRNGDDWEVKDAEWFRSASIWRPNPFMVTRPREGETSASNLMVKREDIDRLWPDAVDETTDAKNKGGRPRYDWDSFHREVIRIANTPDGLPEKQGALEKIMIDWCERLWGKGGESTVRTKISEIYKHLSKT